MQYKHVLQVAGSFTNTRLYTNRQVKEPAAYKTNTPTHAFSGSPQNNKHHPYSIVRQCFPSSCFYFQMVEMNPEATLSAV